MQTIKHGKAIKEARVGNFNTALRSKVLKFLKDAGREDIEIQKLSNVAVNWTVDAGKTELNFEFTCDSDSYEINVKDGKGEKVETWAPQESVAELTDDLNDTLSFIDEFKNSLNTKVSPAKEEAVEESEEDDDEADKNEELNESEDDEKESFELLSQEDKDFIQGLVENSTFVDFGSEIEEYAYECLDLEEVEEANFDAWKDQLYAYADSIDTYDDEDEDWDDED